MSQRKFCKDAPEEMYDHGDRFTLKMLSKLREKHSLDDLAIFGGSVAFESALHVGRPNIGERSSFSARLDDLLDRGCLTNDGPYVQAFEARIRELVGTRHCVATCNATIGLELAIRALDLSGEVIVPSFTFIATVHVLQWAGLKPIFCDIDPQTHNLDPQRVESLITSRTSAILGVHVWGQPCAIDRLTEIASNYNLKLLFDAAHAFGCKHSENPIGNFGDAEVFSFHATKYINAFEGGAIVTNNDALAGKLRLLRNFGFQGYDDVITLGINGKLNEVSAAMGLTSLEAMDHFIEVNACNHLQYQRELEGLPGVRIIRYSDEQRPNYQYVVLEVDPSCTGITRDRIVEILQAENVLARRYFYPGCHQREPYRTLYPDAGIQLPETERLVDRVLSLPNGTAIGADEISIICGLIRLIVNNGHTITQRLAAGR